MARSTVCSVHVLFFDRLDIGFQSGTDGKKSSHKDPAREERHKHIAARRTQIENSRSPSTFTQVSSSLSLNLPRIIFNNKADSRNKRVYVCDLCVKVGGVRERRGAGA